MSPACPPPGEADLITYWNLSPLSLCLEGEPAWESEMESRCRVLAEFCPHLPVSLSSPYLPGSPNPSCPLPSLENSIQGHLECPGPEHSFPRRPSLQGAR